MANGLIHEAREAGLSHWLIADHVAKDTQCVYSPQAEALSLCLLDFVSMYLHVCERLTLRLPDPCPVVSFPCMAMNPLPMHVNHDVRA